MITEKEATRLVEKQGIYRDSMILLKRVHKAIYDMPKKDRIIIGDRLLNYVLSMLSHFSYAWNFQDVRVIETEKFIFNYYEFRSLVRMCTDNNKDEANIIKLSNYVPMAESMANIEEGMKKWRKFAKSQDHG